MANDELTFAGWPVGNDQPPACAAASPLVRPYPRRCQDCWQLADPRQGYLGLRWRILSRFASMYDNCRKWCGFVHLAKSSQNAAAMN
jgi:hypothetical protein